MLPVAFKNLILHLHDAKEIMLFSFVLYLRNAKENVSKKSFLFNDVFNNLYVKIISVINFQE